MPKLKKERVEKRKMADGTIKLYRYPAAKPKLDNSQTVAALLARWQNSPEWETLKPKTTSGYVRYIAPLYEALKTADIATVKRSNILALRDIVAKDNGHGAAKTFCATVSSFFSWLVDQSILEFSPAHRLAGKLRAGTWPAWTLEQALIAEAGPMPTHYRRVVFLARHTAQRRGDLCAMRWSDDKGTHLYVRQEKTGVELDIPISPVLRQALDAWKAETKGLTIIQLPDGRPLGKELLSAQLPIYLQALGLPKGLNIHGLRKLAAATLADAGCSTHEIMSITGHSTLAMVQHYTKSADQRVLSKAAVIRLETYKDKKDHKDTKKA